MVLLTSFSYKENKRYVPEGTLNDFEQSSAQRYVKPVKKMYVAGNLKKKWETRGPVASSSKRKMEQIPEDGMTTRVKKARLEETDKAKEDVGRQPSFQFDDDEDKRIEGLLCYVDKLIAEIHALLLIKKTFPLQQLFLTQNFETRPTNTFTGKHKLDDTDDLTEYEQSKIPRIDETVLDVVYTSKREFPSFVISEKEKRRLDAQLKEIDCTADDSTSVLDVVYTSKREFPSFVISEEDRGRLDAQFHEIYSMTEDNTATHKEICKELFIEPEKQSLDEVMKEIDDILEKYEKPDEQMLPMMTKMDKAQEVATKKKPIMVESENSADILTITKGTSRSLKRKKQSETENNRLFSKKYATAIDSVSNETKKRKFKFIPVFFP